MYKRGEGNFMIPVFITILLAMIVISIIWPVITNKTTSSTISNDQFTGSNTTCTRVTDLCITSLTSVVNASNGIDFTNNVTTCGINGETAGLIVDNNDVLVNGQTLNATYVQLDCHPLTGMTAIVVNYVPLLLAVVLLVFVAVLIK